MHIKYFPWTLSTYPPSFLMPEGFNPVCMLQLQPHQCRTDLKYCFLGHVTVDSTPFLQQYNGMVKNETQCLRDSKYQDGIPSHRGQNAASGRKGLRGLDT